LERYRRGDSFWGLNIPLAIIENLDLKKPSFRPSKWPRKLKPAKNSKLPKWPENQVTKGGGKEKFGWGMSQQQVFDDLKKHLCLTLLLSLLDLQQPFEIETDASYYVVGTILTQHDHPMAYHSEMLSDVVRKYPTYDR
jgi:hypothetical protein